MRTHCITIDLANQGRRQVRARFDGGRMSSDGGALLLQAVDQRIGLTRRLAACFVDHRNPRRCEHSLQRLLASACSGWRWGMRTSATTTGCATTACWRSPWTATTSAANAVCGSATGAIRWPARAPSTGSSWAPPSRPRRTATSASWPTRSGSTRYWWSCSWTATPRRREEIVLDVDATDDPLHGRQEGRFFHGYYDCYCYLPLYVTCGPHLLCGRLRRSNRDAADGAVEELQRIVGQIRQRWPRVRVVVRGTQGSAATS